MSSPRPLLLLLLLGASACTSLQGRARELAERGQYEEAADLYDALVQKRPADKWLASTRDDLRQRALEQLLGRARRYRLEEKDEEAEAFLERFLAARARWGTRLSGALESSLIDEVEGTRQHLRRTIEAPARRGLVLSAEAELARKHTLLAHRELGRLREELTLGVRQGGQASCERLRAARVEGSGAHWEGLVSRYCRRFGREVPLAAPAPEQLGTPTWAGALGGTSPEQLLALQSALGRSFEASPWFAPGAARQPALTLGGSLTVREGREPVRLTAAWEEREPYTHHVEKRVEREQAYEKEETYMEDGKRKTRKVTAFRTVYNVITVPETRYRYVPREFHYGALRVWADYRFSASVTGALAEGRAPLALLLEDAKSEVAFEHDTRFGPGNVQPTRAKLTGPGAWFAQKRQGLQDALGPQLVHAWREAYCASAAYSLEEAARCARGGVAVPDPARDVLAQQLAGDAAHVHRLFAP